MTRDIETNEVTVEFDTECPSCAASIAFDPASGLLECPYCGYRAEIPIPEQQQDTIAREINFHDAQARGNFDWGVEKKRIICEACAAETIYDALQVADTCPYCGSHQVMEASASDTLAPNGVIPFAVTKQQAGEAFHQWIKGRIFTPSKAKKSAKPDAFQGVYMPFWTFDTNTMSHYSARYGINHYYTDREGKTQVETKWYRTSGIYQQHYDDYLVSATNRYDRDMLAKIQPFDSNNAKGYKPEYVAGFLAERYSIGLDDGWRIAQQGIHGDLDSQIRQEIRMRHRADHVQSLQFSTTHDDITFKYVMLPIWLSSFQYKQKLYRFMVNGQTGKVGGDAPISPLRVAIAIMLTMLVIGIFYVLFGESSYY
ncbi:hypothetical protein [Caryophanon tenue]|uniref:Primosomal protein N' (Replication factor Y)-superfamily II helicase n=1 Tax=Caryophanon tenue TaxID=33978 RepID=A0A1C0Y754_9BACL|nr:hypothetical protein [Caryophanon tenue]OCS82981.1 hypothetical protein A6M13_06160 [Caryophanon tenue]